MINFKKKVNSCKMDSRIYVYFSIYQRYLTGSRAILYVCIYAFIIGCNNLLLGITVTFFLFEALSFILQQMQNTK